ncbi:unnamed protein product [Dibothriocephalus latus]|uniref:Uncharacterized protein n=1 Tax=Dibothriocephalus latus TaxID=60516 RepID=A0A3P7PE14_DIBLA|nr:unnamed protein product [Dibothriocephalus latus]
MYSGLIFYFPSETVAFRIHLENTLNGNILSIPWVELGGRCTIDCPRTGYSATVDFRTKPFYGGKKDQIRAEVFAPGEKRPLLTVDGEWNGKMWAKWAEGKSELFVDTKAMPIMMKRLRPREIQTANESRKYVSLLFFDDGRSISIKLLRRRMMAVGMATATRREKSFC